MYSLVINRILFPFIVKRTKFEYLNCIIGMKVFLTKISHSMHEFYIFRGPLDIFCVSLGTPWVHLRSFGFIWVIRRTG